MFSEAPRRVRYFPRGWRRLRGMGICRRPERYWPVRELRGLQHLCGGPAENDFPAVDARPRAEVDYEIGLPDRFFVMLHDQDRIAQIAQALQGGKEAGVVPLVKADARFVQNIQDAHEPGADLGGQPDALGFPARKRRRGAGQGQVVQPHVHQKSQAFGRSPSGCAGRFPFPGERDPGGRRRRGPPGSISGSPRGYSTR